MDFQAILLLVTCVCSTVLISILKLLSNQTKSYSTKLKLPPGPLPYPIIGNILNLGTKPHKSLTKLSKTYGPIMTLKLGNIATIVISSPQVAKQVLQENGHVFSNRLVPHAATILNHHNLSVGWLPPTPQWKKLRKICATKVFSLKVLDSTKNIRQEKVQVLLDYVTENCKKGEAFDIGEAVFTTVLNVITNTFFSKDLANSSPDERSNEFKNIIWCLLEDTGKPNVADFFPILRPFDPQRIFARMTNHSNKLYEIFEAIIDERLCSRASRTDSSGEWIDVLDSLINSMEESGSELSPNEIIHLFLDLFVAGIDTTASTIEWTMAELLRNPDKLTKARKELCEVISHKDEEKTVEESQVSNLPFLQAVVKESLRLHPPAPLLVPHKSDAIVEICGFQVPKDAQILVNVWAMGRDPIIWDNPNTFLPERFLDSDINYKGNHFELIPFGAGKRICPGMPLAHRTVHLMLASLLHNFEWKLADGLKPEHMDMDDQFGLTLKRVQPLRVQAISTKHD